MTATAAELSVPVDASGAVAADLACTGCGYNLRTCHRDGVCPECGEAVAQSLRPDLLRFAPRGHVFRLKAGVVCGVLAAALQVLILLATLGLNLTGFGGMWMLYVHALSAIPLLLLALVAAFFVTETPRGGRATVAAAFARWAMLPAALALIGLAIAETVMYAGFARVVLSVCHTLTGLLWLAAVAALVLHASRVAGRIPSRPLARRVIVAGYAFVALGMLVTMNQLAFMLYFEFIFAPSGMASPQQDTFFTVMQVVSYGITTLWLLSMIGCAVVGVMFFLRLRRVGAG